VDAFAVGVGPGSFTGLRIGITTARTLAHSLGKALVPISSLAALVRPVAQHFSSGLEKVMVISAVDACKGELFALWGRADEVQKCSVRGSSPNFSLWSARVREEVLTPTQLGDRLLSDLRRDGTQLAWAAVGEGVQRYPDLWQQLPQEARRYFPFPFSNQVSGHGLGLMACEALFAQSDWDALKIYPSYLRASDAELKLKAGLLAQSKRS
jgi:tRNA threonylcarbamoyladenosine biosynthesis protein TsaB